MIKEEIIEQNQTPCVSIIVPIYNAEKHLNRCVESILAQDFDDFELILVNDGSTDNSKAICDMYEQKDSRVKVIHKENTGVSDSRNQAVAIAKGTYLQFVDSDDWLTSESTRLLINTMRENHCDMVVADFYRVINDNVSCKSSVDGIGIMSREQFALEMMESPANFYYGVLWNKLYRKDVIKKYNLHMDEVMDWCEDFLFNMEYIRHIEKVFVLHVPIYYYVKTPGSLATQGVNIVKAIRMKKNVFKYYKEFYKEIFNEEDYEKVRRGVYKFLVDIADDGEISFFDIYREKKLLDYYLKSVEQEYDLTFEEVKLLFALCNMNKEYTYKEMADELHISLKKLKMTIDSLVEKEMLMEERDKRDAKHLIEMHLSEKAVPVINSLLVAMRSYKQVLYKGFTEEEITQYQLLSKRMMTNINQTIK